MFEPVSLNDRHWVDLLTLGPVKVSALLWFHGGGSRWPWRPWPCSRGMCARPGCGHQRRRHLIRFLPSEADPQKMTVVMRCHGADPVDYADRFTCPCDRGFLERE